MCQTFKAIMRFTGAPQSQQTMGRTTHSSKAAGALAQQHFKPAQCLGSLAFSGQCLAAVDRYGGGERHTTCSAFSTGSCF